MKDITFIFPVFELNKEENLEGFNEALKSLGKSKNVIVVGSKEDLDLVKAKKVTKVENTTGDLSYSNQVMLAVKEVKTEYFSVIEQDDTVVEKWYEYLSEYSTPEFEDVFAFLPLTEVTDNGEIIGYANEAFWASSFSEKLGYLDISAMEDYLDFNVSGAVFKTHEFLALGGLKTSMKLTFWLEFILRALYKEKKMFVVPRVGYFHKANREGSLLDTYSKTMSDKEVEFWLDLAKKEYYFPQDRNKTYEEE